MATSERFVSTLAGAAGVEQATAHPGFARPITPAWRQAIFDFLTISLGLGIVHATFDAGVSANGAGLSVLSVATTATMITIILAFSGAYPSRATPISIGGTEGLVRGLCCALLLLILGSGAMRATPPAVVLRSALVVIGLLVLQRELAHVLGGEPRPATAMAQRPLRLVDADDYVCHCRMTNSRSGAGYLLKRGLDVAVAILVLFTVSPLLFVVAALIKLESRGPVLIRQQRIGKAGVPFFMWKFRSMHAGVCRYAPSPVSDGDPRLTRVGRVLRRLSIDELPQLINVLRGEMSLVGPRPEMPFIVRNYRSRERLRLEAKPGITGLWQISPARAMPIHENLELDLFYIAHDNIFLDLAILLRTVTAVVRGIGAT
jgi:lipopolysaccharide/colanic/teichoic acid biosynthesis glycosyltransferase